jgi:hypothetical protein
MERQSTRRPFARRWLQTTALTTTVCAAGAAGLAVGSDHQDTPEVELNPKMDMTDVYAFPSATPGRIVLVMNSRVAAGAESSASRCT